MGLSSRRRGPGRAVLVSVCLFFTACAFCADALAREDTPRLNELELWPTVKIALAWAGMIGGGVIALGCLAGALLGMLQGRANPFGKGASEFWLSFAIGLAFAGLAYYCVHLLFLKDAKGEKEEKPPAPAQAVKYTPLRQVRTVGIMRGDLLN